MNDFGCIADVYDQLVGWAPYKRWVEHLEGRLRTWGLGPGDAILDSACGTGLSTVPWALRGYEVVGADVSEQMLEVARRRAREAGCSIRFLRQNITDLHPGRLFRVVICMHSGLDYILEPTELRRAFRSVRGCLNPGGLFALDKCLDVPSFYKEDYAEMRQLDCGTAEFHYRWDRGRRLFEQRCVVRRDGGGEPTLTEVTFHLKATPPERLRTWLRQAGFEELEPVREFTVLDPGMGIFRAV